MTSIILAMVYRILNLQLSPFSAFRNHSPEGLRHKLSAVRTLCEPEQAKATHDVPLR
ncbi:hypothetical protein H6F98_22210 [Microcoleus sp. FACHB-SPT15]|uniref:hypothetical protein n=1 Tax=Microcoleus sp. FACHB-SPT15 TaxID=2692830 RepID=UPI001782D277|nr:hypothetical protein [Microcoleus sp. FACHB-SPT15]MBD1808147.1 hypothetical protein [Microcoleus sp. FACHB-SPT15]